MNPDPQVVYAQIKQINADFTFSFNIIYPDIFMDREIYDRLDLPHCAFFVDHPFHHVHRFRNPESANLKIACVDRSHGPYIEYFLGKKGTWFLPHGAMKLDPATADLETEKTADFLFIGNLVNPEDYLGEISKKFEPPVWKIIRDIIDFSLANPTQSLLEMIRRVLLERKLESLFENRQYVQIILKIVEHYFRNRTRLDSLLALEGFNLRIYGFIDPSLAALHEIFRDRIKNPVGYRDIPPLISQSRCVLNFMQIFSRGSHERVFQSLIQKVPVLSTHSEYLAEEFGTDRAVFMFKTDDAETLRRKASYILGNEAALEQELGLAQKKVEEKHTWEARAKEIIELMKNG